MVIFTMPDNLEIRAKKIIQAATPTKKFFNRRAIFKSQHSNT